MFYKEIVSVFAKRSLAAYSLWRASWVYQSAYGNIHRCVSDVFSRKRWPGIVPGAHARQLERLCTSVIRPSNVFSG